MFTTPPPDRPQAPPPLDFRTAYCRSIGCPTDEFEPRVLRQTLFFQARLVRGCLRPFRPGSFFPEYLLVKQAGDKQSLADVQLDIDFYQHKHVVGQLLRESCNLRLSGRRLMALARRSFAEARAGEAHAAAAALRERHEGA